jgi:hypothetical protein
MPTEFGDMPTAVPTVHFLPLSNAQTQNPKPMRVTRTSQRCYLWYAEPLVDGL